MRDSNELPKLIRMKVPQLLFILTVLILNNSCRQNQQTSLNLQNWKVEFENQLPLLGHRNWILVVDKAFPLQNAGGITTLYTDEKLLDVLRFTLDELADASHVKPVIYTDSELDYLNEEMVPGVGEYRESLGRIFGSTGIRTILHDSVFVKIDEASELFGILVLKTNETIPYSSVFLELDCKYWSPGQENKLRQMMPVIN